MKPLPASQQARQERRDGNVLCADELRRLFDAAEGVWKGIVMTVALCGLRRSELFGLRWEDVDLTGARVRVRKQMVRGQFAEPKSHAAVRSVPMPAELVSVMRRWKLACPKGELDLVFPNPAGGPIKDTSAVERGLGGALRRAGVKRVTLHELRHTYATHLAMANVPPKVAQSLLGHANVVLTLGLYAHVLSGSDDGVADVLFSRVFGGNKMDTFGGK